MAIRNGTPFADFLEGTTGADYISGLAGDDTLYGYAGDDYIYGGDGDDIIYDYEGRDHVFGQGGDDIFVLFTGEADFVDGGDGIDIIYYLTAGDGPTVVDMLSNGLNSGAAAGDQLVNVEGFLGSDVTDIVSGTDGQNRFFGSGGNDQYFGRGGQDIYFALGTVIPVPVGSVSTFEIAFGSRASALATAAGIAAPPAGAAVAYYEIWNDANFNGIQDAGEITKNADLLSKIEYFVGTYATGLTSGNDRMTGSSADEWFSPLTGANKVDGGAGFDILTYSFLGIGTGVTVDLAAGTAVIETTSTITNIEGVNGSDYADQLMGNSAANELMGMDGNDALDGRGGNDELHGGKGDDILVGGAGNDILVGGLGIDTLDGGDGIDTLSYASAAAGIEVSLLRGAGFDRTTNGVFVPAPDSSGDIILNVENVVGSLYDDQIAGNDDANVIEGRKGNDEINGCAGNDIIYGDMNPKSAVPEFIPEPSTADNNIIDDCECDGSDFTGDVPANTYDDTIFGAEGNDIILGQLGDDKLDGGEGNDALKGGDGDDIIQGNVGNDSLNGELGTDILFGGDGSDTISGGGGFDIIFGGAGNDTVDYSASPSAVTVNLGEFWMNSGGDASADLLSQIMQQLSDGADPSTVMESALFLSFLSLIASTGTDSAFTLSIPDVILGAENVTGSAFADTIIGDTFANVLNGGLGADYLEGGLGNDTYVVDNSGDEVVETAAAGGIDLVKSSRSYALGDNLENLTLTGSAAVNGIGNELANIMIGNAAANILKGGIGADKLNGGAGADRLVGGLNNDQLTGGTGKDTFLFDSALNASNNVDSITDFVGADDTIALLQSAFAGIGAAGTLAAGAFVVGTAAADAADRIIYDQTTGRIYFDADGTGASGKILFAKVASGTVLTNSDFSVVGSAGQAPVQIALDPKKVAAAEPVSTAHDGMHDFHGLHFGGWAHVEDYFLP